MKSKAMIILIILSGLSINVYADINPDVIQGAERYDWRDCADSMRNYCMNTTCLTSEDRHCKDTCTDTARDKCLLQGVKPYRNVITY